MPRKGFAEAGLLMLLLMACSLALPLSSQIVGTWKMDTNPNFTITFSANGQVTNSLGAHGTWSMSGDKLTLQWDGDSPNLIIVAINGDRLTLTRTIVTTFTRVQ